MTLEEKNERYEAANKLLKVSNYISVDELKQLNGIITKCYLRYESISKNSVTET